MKYTIITILTVFALFTACENKEGGKSTASDSGEKKEKKFEKVDLKNENDSAAYAIGVNFSQGLKMEAQRGTGEDTVIVEAFIQGIKDYLNESDVEKYSRLRGAQIAQQLASTIRNNKLEGELNDEVILTAMRHNLNDDSLNLDQNAARGVLTTFGQKVTERLKKVNLEEGEKFLAEIAKKSGVTKTTSGLLYEVLKEGAGEKPDSTNQVFVLYTGKLLNGKVFDTTDWRNEQPFEVSLTQGQRNSVIEGWREGLSYMNEGSKYRFYIPSELAYGDRGSQGIGPNETLIFDVEMLEIVKPEATDSAQVTPVAPKGAGQ